MLFLRHKPTRSALLGDLTRIGASSSVESRSMLFSFVDFAEDRNGGGEDSKSEILIRREEGLLSV